MKVLGSHAEQPKRQEADEKSGREQRGFGFLVGLGQQFFGDPEE